MGPTRALTLNLSFLRDKIEAENQGSKREVDRDVLYHNKPAVNKKETS